MRRLLLMAVVLVIVMALTSIVVDKFLAPLPAPIPQNGQIVDAATGKPVIGAKLETRWRLYDYPMPDGSGSCELSSLTQTDANGRFSLVIPHHRRGLWNTEAYPPTIAAAGYNPFTFDNTSAV